MSTKSLPAESMQLTVLTDTDLSDIPDDRDPDANEDTTVVKHAFVEKMPSKKEKTKPNKKRKGRKGQRSPSSTVDRGPHARPSEGSKMNDTRSLEEREPEAFSIYATSEPDDGEEHGRDAAPDATKSLSGDESASANAGAAPSTPINTATAAFLIGPSHDAPEK